VKSRAASALGGLDGGRAATGHALALALGTAVAGIAAYGYIAVGTRVYGATEFAPVAVVWSLWPAAAAAFAFPLEQWIAREMAEGGSAERRVRAMLEAALPAIATICILGGAVAWLAGERLFGEAGPLYPAILVAVCIGAASMGVLRGGLAGRGRYRASAVATALENVIRLVPALIVAAAGLGVRAFAAVLVLGPLVGLVWPEAFRYRTEPGDTAPAGTARSFGALAGGALLAQIVLAAPPVILAVMVGPTEAVTGVFVALALFRAPYLVAVGVSVRALPRLTRDLARSTHAQLGRALGAIAAATTIAMAATALVAPLVMPTVIELIFGADSVPSDGAIAGLAAGVVGAHGALAAMLALLVAGRNEIALHAWIVGCLANLFLLALPVADETKVAVAFAGAELIAVCSMAVGTMLAPRAEHLRS